MDNKYNTYESMMSDLVTATAQVQELFQHRQGLARHGNISLDVAHTHQHDCTPIVNTLRHIRDQLEREFADMTGTIDRARQDRLLSAITTPTQHDQP